MASWALMAVAEGLLDDHRRDERVAAAVGEADRVTGGDEADEHGGRAGLGGAVDLEADRAGAAIDERDLAVRVREIRIIRVGVVDGAGRATAPDVGDVAAEPVSRSGPSRRSRCSGTSPSMAAGLLTTSGNATALGTWVWATDRAVRALAGVPAMYGLSPPLPAAATVSMPERGGVVDGHREVVVEGSRRSRCRATC